MFACVLFSLHLLVVATSASFSLWPTNKRLWITSNAELIGTTFCHLLPVRLLNHQHFPCQVHAAYPSTNERSQDYPLFSFVSFFSPHYVYFVCFSSSLCPSLRLALARGVEKISILGSTFLNLNCETENRLHQTLSTRLVIHYLHCCF